MMFLLVFIVLLLWITSILGYGSLLLFSKDINVFFKEVKTLKITIFGIFGLFILSILGNFFNFFIPLNRIFILIIFLIGFFIFIFNFKKIFLNIKFYYLIFSLILILYLAFIPFNWAKFNDTGIYHIQSIKWLNESRLPLGLANLHGRFGFNSSWFTVASIVENFLLIKRSPIFIINSIMVFFTGVSFFINIFEQKTKLSKFSDIYLALCLIPWFRKTSFNMGSASPAPDLPVMLLTLFIIFLLIKALEDITNYRYYCFFAIIFSCFSFTIKLSSFPLLICSLLLLVYLEIKSYRQNQFKNINFKNHFYFNTFVLSAASLIVWVLRNIFISGCFVYPVRFGYFSKLKWAVDYSILKDENDWIKSWARQAGANPSEVLNNWSWFKPWLSGFVRSEKLLLSILALGLLLIIFYFIKFYIFKRNKRDKKINYSLLVISLVISFIGILFWFLSAPDPRFGYGFLFSFALILLAFGLYINNFGSLKFVNNKTIGLIIFLFFLTTSRNLIINENSLNLIKSNTWIKMSEVNYEIKHTIYGNAVNVPVNTDQCWDLSLPATPYFKENLKIEHKEDIKFYMFWFPDNY